MQRIDETLSFDLAALGKAHRQVAGTLLAELGLHPGQEFLLLTLMENDGITQSALVECARVEPPTIARSLARLERLGLVVRRPDAADARVLRVSLTGRGRELWGGVEMAWLELERRTILGLTDVEVALLHRMLRQMRDNLR